MAGSRITAADIHVGRRVKMARLAAGISQEKLAHAVGVTFQQIQKYENGVNRIGSGRLHAIAKVLGVPLAHFFDDLDRSRPGKRNVLAAIDTALGTKEGMRIAIALSRVKSPDLRRRVADLVEKMVDDGR